MIPGSMIDRMVHRTDPPQPTKQPQLPSSNKNGVHIVWKASLGGAVASTLAAVATKAPPIRLRCLSVTAVCGTVSALAALYQVAKPRTK